MALHSKPCAILALDPAMGDSFTASPIDKPNSVLSSEVYAALEVAFSRVVAPDSILSLYVLDGRGAFS